MLQNAEELIMVKMKTKSIQTEENFRYYVAERENSKEPVDIENIISYTKEILSAFNMKTSTYENKYYQISLVEYNFSFPKERYKKIKEQFNLASQKDIIWMKFTKNGHLGVVATSDDINFNLDNSSGKIIQHIGQDWNREFVLVFPLDLSQCSKFIGRQEIESAVGNYLIKKGIPIIDYYSHNL